MKCKICESARLTPFLAISGAPMLSNVLYKSAKTARNAALADIDLRKCEVCGFVHNYAFNGAPYGKNYENAQETSENFSQYLAEIAENLAQNYGILRAKIIEVGCGNGAFLRLLCERTDSEGVGFDPSYSAARVNFAAVKSRESGANLEAQTRESSANFEAKNRAPNFENGWGAAEVKFASSHNTSTHALRANSTRISIF